jgi:hypothetical protein
MPPDGVSFRAMRITTKAPCCNDMMPPPVTE